MALDERYLNLHASGFNAGAFRVMSLRGVEVLSGLYHFDVDFGVTEDAAHEVATSLLGGRLWLTLSSPDGFERTIAGVATRLESRGLVPQTRERLFRARLAPAAALLARDQDSRIFQDTSVQKIVSTLLDERRIAHRFRLTQPLPARGYCTQYRESTWAFITRLLAEEGVLFYFEHPDVPGAEIDAHEGPTEVLVFTDSNTQYPVLGAPVRMGTMGVAHASAQVDRFVVRRAIQAGAVALQHFDFLRPRSQLASRARVSPPEAGFDEGQIEVYEHHNEYDGQRMGRDDARIVMEQVRTRAESAQGRGWCKRFAPGHVFTLEDVDQPEHDGSYVLVRVRHRAAEGGVAEPATARGDDAVRGYRNEFDCVPARVTARPRPPRRRPQQVMEHATVVGAAGDEVHTDHLGRVRVQFHWDRRGRNDERSSCWLRVLTPWAGDGWGMHFVPRVGMEVVVGFLAGDVDRPHVMGASFNGANPAPYAATRSGVRSQSTPGGDGFNELYFEDQLGAEELGLRAERDLVELVRNERRAKIDGDRRTEIGRDDALSVAGNRTEEVALGRTLTVGQDLIETIGGERGETVIGRKAIHVNGDFEQRVAGQTEILCEGDRAVQVGGAARVHVGGDDSRDVQGRSERATEMDSVTRVAGCAVTVVGRPEAARAWTLHVEGHCTSQSTATNAVVSDAEVVLRCGKSSLVLTPDGITLRAPKLVFDADAVETYARRSDLLVEEIARTRAKTVLALGERASVELGRDARIDGASVKLKAPPQQSDDPGLPARVAPTLLAVRDADGGPLAGERYVLVLPDGSQRAGVLDADGAAEIHGLTQVADLHLPDVPDLQLGKVPGGDDDDDAGTGFVDEPDVDTQAALEA